MSDPKKLFIKTYGCQMNVYDSERMAEALGGQGYVETKTADDADMILLNTCHIREKAAEKIYSELGRFKGLKAANPDLKIGVAGCVAQAEGAEIMKRQPMVDLVVGPQSYHRLPAMEQAVAGGAKALDTDFPEDDKFETLKTRAKIKRGPTAFLTVQEGCDKFCAFCVVPYTRGAEVSRPADRIIREAQELVEAGVKEITLLGQNVNAYHGHDGGLAMDDALIDAHGTCDKLMPYLHLPVQSGSDRILKAMNRKHTRDQYFKLIDRIRSARPDLLLSGDFIVGFPGETDQDFEDTMDLIRHVHYGQAYSFKYSTRPGTPAAEKEQLPDDLMTERLHRMQALLGDQQRATQDSMIGQTVKVLFEKAGRETGQMIGKSEYLHAVFADATDVQIGDLRDVRITKSERNSLGGEIL